ncbi:MAG TPA: hypothetical protein VFG56_00415 [Candidatus Saccharimonadales bacterium]|nr:hypothetical protein [Candidatus Saccharimonadales bacterium]
MNDAIYDDLAIEGSIREQFSLQLDIKHVIVRGIPTSRTTKASVFLTTKNKLFVYIDGQEPLSLSDVTKMIKRMGLVAKAYLPPRREDDYFDRIARGHFKKVYPGHPNPSDEDLRYYRSLAPYNPALVEVEEITAGVIYQFDSNDSSNWRTAAKFSYRRIKAL